MGIKMMCGLNDMLSVRKMHQNEMYEVASFMDVIMSSNTFLQLSSYNSCVARRLRAVRFTTRFVAIPTSNTEQKNDSALLERIFYHDRLMALVKF
jgi:phage/plasmid-associated DNA primase